MPIAIGTVCEDGLVLCADEQITQTDSKYNESKLSSISLANGRTIVLAYAGSPDTMRVIYQGLRARLDGQNKSYDQIQVDLQETLDSVIPRNSKDTHQILYGMCDRRLIYLMKSFNRIISPVPVWDCIGFGDRALTRYLGAIFLGTEVHLPLLRAVPICNYMIAQAKKYVQWCGGPTDLMVLTPEGIVLEQSSATALDALCDLVEQSLNALLTSATEPNISPEQCEKLIKQLRDVLEAPTRAYKAFLH